MTLTIHTIRSRDYYDVRDMYRARPKLFPNCSKRRSNIFTCTDKPSAADCIYATVNKLKQYEIYSGDVKPAKAVLYVSCEWYNALIQRIDNPEEIKEDIKIVPDNKQIVSIKPKLDTVVLLDTEQWKDLNGNPVHIHMIGERTRKGLYMRYKDICKVFEIMYRFDDVTGDDTLYVAGRDYIFYSHGINMTVNSQNYDEKNETKQELYLTTNGMMKCCYKSRSKHADIFQDWVTDIVFVAGFGTADQKAELARNISPYGVSIDKAKQITGKETSVLYLLLLGTVQQCKDKICLDGYADGLFVAKYGRTSELNIRLAQHKKYFNNLSIEPNLIYTVCVHHSQLVEAESAFKQYTVKNGWNVTTDIQYTELIVFTEKQLNSVKIKYNKICVKYAESIDELRTEFERVNQDLESAFKKNDNLSVEHKQEISDLTASWESKCQNIMTQYEQNAKHYHETMSLKDDIIQSQLVTIQLNSETVQAKNDTIQTKNDVIAGLREQIFTLKAQIAQL
jgi:hypothetical protein